MIEVTSITRPEDFTIDKVYEIFREVGDRFPPEHGSINITHMVNEWQKMLQAKLGVTWLATENGKPIGVLGMLVLIDFYTGKKMAFEQFWFVLESHRRGGAGLKLFKKFESAASKLCCDTVWAGYNLINSPPGLKEFYKRKGFLEWGATFRKVIKNG